MTEPLGQLVGVFLHRVQFIRFVAFAVTAQVNRQAPVIGREILLLEREARPVAEPTVDEDDGRVAGAELVVGETHSVGGGEPFSHVTEIRETGTSRGGRHGAQPGGTLYLDGKVYWNTPPVRIISAAMASACSMKRRSMALT